MMMRLLIFLFTTLYLFFGVQNVVAQFAIFQVQNSNVVKYNIVTDGGALCNGTPTTDAAKFVAFNTWALANQGTSQVQLTIPAGANCVFEDQSAFFWAKGINNLLVLGDGATLTNPSTTQQRFVLGGTGLIQDASHSARTATVSAGSSCVTLSTPAQTSLFTVGNYALMTGFDLQGIWKGNFGYPPNPHYLNYVIVASKDVGHSGEVCFTSSLTYTYKSTWPHYADGSPFEIDQGGPATLYYLDPSWNATFEYRGLTIVNDSWQTYANGKNVTFRDVTFTGSNCGIASQNLIWSLINVTGTSCDIEADKLVDTIIITNTTINQLDFQSSSINQITANNLTVLDSFFGTPKVANISNSNMSKFGPGAHSYGRSDETTCTTCAIASFLPKGIADVTCGGLAVNIGCSMSSGVISYPNGKTVSNATTGGACTGGGNGCVRLTLNNSTGLVTGQVINIVGLASFDTNLTAVTNNGGNARLTVASTSNFSTGQFVVIAGASGTPGVNGSHQITVVNGTTVDTTVPFVATGVTGNCSSGGACMSVGTSEANGGNRLLAVVNGTTVDLPGITFLSSYVSGGDLGNLAPRWAVPGTNVFWTGTQTAEALFQVIDVTQDANNTYIQTSMVGGFPTLPGSVAGLIGKVHPAPKFTCTGCTGDAGLMSLAGAPAQAPLYSYTSHTYTGAVGGSVQPIYTAWGVISSLTMNVTNAYVGAGTLSFSLSQFNNWETTKPSDGSVYSYNLSGGGPIVNAKIAGSRVITSAGVTGTQAGDVGLPVPEAIQFGDASKSGSIFSTDVSGVCPGANCPSVTVTIQTNQGVVNP